MDALRRRNASNLRPLEGGEILSRLPGLRMLHLERPVKDRGVVEYVGQKPFDGTIPPTPRDGRPC